MTYGFSVRCVFHCHRWLRHLCCRFVFVLLLALEQRVKAETEEEQEEAEEAEEEEEAAAPAATPPVYSETNED